MAVFDGVIPAIVGAANAAGGVYEITRSVRFNSADSAYLDRTPSTGGNRKTWTWSGWIKRSALASQQAPFTSTDGATATTAIYFSSTDKLVFYTDRTGVTTVETDGVLRDPSAWYHAVIAVDTTQATSTDRVKIYLNGVQQTLSGTYPAQNFDTEINRLSFSHKIGGLNSSTWLFNGYLADIYFIDGQALAASDFGAYDDNNVWQPKAYSGTYGTNGFHLDFSDNSSASALGTDSSGNSNTWTVNNFSVAPGADNDSLIDTPTDYEAASGENGGNYCTWNPLDMETGVITLSEGNLKTVTTSSTGDNVRGTFGFSSGKWYWECTVTDFSGGFDIGFATPEWVITAGDVGSVANSWSVSDSGTSKNQGSNTGSATSPFNSVGKVIGIAFDADAGSVKYFIDGTDQGVIFSGLDTSETYIPAIYLRVATTGGIWNFGQRGSYTYAPPSGYKALCTTNLDDPTIADGSTAMDAVLYTGNGSTQSIAGLDFAPDLVWIKSRSQAVLHVLTDTVRGATKELSTSSNVGETTNADGLTAFNSDGFDLGADVAYNTNTESYVAWTWDGGTSTVTNTDGDLNSQVRANPSTGLSINTHSRTTAASISTWGHGLGAAPEFAILKPTNISGQWFAWHKNAGNNRRFYISSNSVGNTYGFDVWSSDSTTLGIYGTIIAGGGTALDCLTYAWAPVEGYSAFGSYTGNGSTDGPFVYTGFRPAFVLIKNISAAANWMLYDTARNTFNESPYVLSPNTSDGGLTYDAYSGSFPIDILSNGFKPRSTLSNINGSTNTLVYACFAEHPFKTARAR